MLKVYDKNKNYIQGIVDYKDARTEQELNITDTLLFRIPKSLGDVFEEEGYVETKKDGRFVIKEKNLTNDGYEIVGKYDLEDLFAWIDSQSHITMTMAEIMDDLLDGTGWTVVTSGTIKRTVTGSNMSVLEFIYKAIDIFKYDIRFDNINKIIYTDEELGSDKGVYFHDEVNLKSLNTTSDTYDFATRLIPVGFNGMGIELINDGKSYVENHTYSDKVVTVYWQDERYTVIENLKADAEKRLAKICMPLSSYQADVQDLSRNSGYKILAYETGDTITLVNKETKTREKQRIMKKVKWLDEPERDSVVIANRPRFLGDKQEKIVENLRNSFNITKASLELFEDSIKGRVSTVEGVVTSLEDDYTQHKTEVDGRIDGLGDNIDALQEDYEGNKQAVDARITENTTEIEAISTELSSKVSKTEYDGDYKKISDNYTEFRQQFDNFTSTIQVGGGNNLIRNSVGYGEMNYWALEDGEVDYSMSTWVLEGTAKYGWKMSHCVMWQEINLLPNTEYTISGRLLKSTPAGDFRIALLSNEVELHTAIEKLDSETFNGSFSLQFNSDGITQLQLLIQASGASTAQPIELTDLMLARGQNYTTWSQAAGEIYTLNVRMDGEGIKVYSADGRELTVISPREFAGYYNNQKVFTLNRDITEVMGLDVGGKGLFIRPVKFVQTSNSLDVVWTGR